MSRLVVLALTSIVAGVAYFINLLIKKRRQMDKLPSPPRKSFIFGNLDIAGECRDLFPLCHVQNWIGFMQKKYCPGKDCFYVDWWPLGPRWLFMSNPQLIDQYITTTNSLPKSPLEVAYLNTFLGKNNMVTVEGQQWKALRSMFNPGFSASHLMTLTGYIVNASTVFCDALREKAKTNELFELEEYATRLTIDIIGKVVLDSDFDSQKTIHPIVDAFRKRVLLMPHENSAIDLSRFELRRRFKLWLNGRKLDRLLGEEIDRKMAARASADSTPKSFKDRKRSVVDLAMDAYAKEQQLNADAKKPNVGQVMDSSFRQAAVDSCKTFIFAGHDTTSSTIAYLFYLLHFHPEVKTKILAELDVVFGPNASTATIAEAIKADPYIINRLEYIIAVIKETLRLFPPASTLRYVPEPTSPSEFLYMVHPETGEKLPISGFHAWPAVILVHRNETFFPEPVKFIPERFIPSQTPFPDSKLFTPAGKDAWRPFEKGPRNCIGQELAMIEAKIIVAMSIREFDFVAEFDGVKVESLTPVETTVEFADGKLGKDRRTIEGHKAYTILKGSAKPRDGMPGRMYLANEGKLSEKAR